jgi:putative ABC transport system ATP-binding protein
VSDRISQPAVLALREARFRWPRSEADTVAIESLDIGPGEQVFMHGPSGCGKSTLLSLLGGVLLASSGSVALLGQDWSGLPGWRRDAFRVDHVGFIFQQFNLLPYLSVIDNAWLPCRLSRRRESNARSNFPSSRAQAEHLLAAMRLPRVLWNRPASEISVGQQQRVAAARALVGMPDLVLADEPTSALDEDNRGLFLDLLLGLCETAGSALVFVSHDLRIAQRFTRSLSLPQINRAPIPAVEGA